MADTISAAALVDAIIRLAPASAPVLGRLAEGLASGAVQMQAFCKAVREELGDTILVEALLMMQGARVPFGSAADIKELVDHVRVCGGGCSKPGCAQVSIMLATIRSHCMQCAAPQQCGTCQRWAHICYDTPRMAVVRVAAAAPAASDAAFANLDAVGHPLRAGRSAVAKPSASHASHKEALPALLMLARSALGDITTSPGSSRCNSPTAAPSSPKRGPGGKRVKAGEVSALSKVARCSAAADAPTVVRAAAVVHATPMEMGAAPPRLAALPVVAPP